MKLTDLPEEPGVYLFMDIAYKVIYAGKAKSIKKRVKSHFGGKELNTRHMAMISQVRTVDFITTKDEREALVLEDQLIKSLKPRYNIALRDDKSYPFLELTVGEKYPTLKVTRNRDTPDSVYFGPYPNVKDIRAVKRAIDRIFPIRECRDFKVKERSCLNFQMKRCKAPCAEQVDEAQYREIVEEVKLFLSDKKQKLMKRLHEKMQQYKKVQQYEMAAMVRDQIKRLENFTPMVNFRKITRKKAEILSRIDPLYLLKDILNMEHKPKIIEGFDISHISSTQAAGSMVYFEEGEPDKSNYKRFKIKQLSTSDDLKMLQEIIYRRLRRLIRENRILPDILLIDGGRGQDKAAREIVDKFNLKNIRVLALAKDTGNIYYKGKKLPVEKDSEVFKLLKRVDDEAHRFAHAYHLIRRKKQFEKR